MKSSILRRAALTAVLALASTACGDSNSMDRADSGATGASSSDGGSPGTSSVGGPAGDGPTLIETCPDSLDGPGVCLEQLEGRPEDTLLVGLFVYSSPSCDEIGGVNASVDILPDPDSELLFSVQAAGESLGHKGSEPISEPANECLSRYTTNDNGDVYVRLQSWTKWTEGTGCDQPARSGRYAQLRITIRRETPPGDYPLEFRTATVYGASVEPACASLEGLTTISGLVRVR